jgi:hypothetical protein
VTPTPPVPAQPDGWRLPDRLDPDIPIPLLLTGILVSSLLALLVVLIIGRAWAACVEVSMGDGFGLMVVTGLLAIGLSVIFGASLLLTVERQGPLRFCLGMAAVLIATLIFVTIMVPRPGHSPLAAAAHPACRADGIPTWWPSWLPS